MKILDRLREVRTRPGDCAEDLLDGRWKMTYKQALERSGKISTYLRAHLEPSDRIAVGIRDDIEVTVLFLACLESGVVPIFIDVDASAAEVRILLEKSEVKWLIAEPDLVERWSDREMESCIKVLKVEPARPRKQLVSRWLGATGGETNAAPETYPACAEQGGEPASEYRPRPDDFALLLYTSGTTGGPKIVPLTRGNVIAQARTMSTRLQLDSGARVLNLMPIAYFDGLLTGVLVSLWVGGTMVRLRPFTVTQLPETLDSIYKYRVTHMICVPTVLALMLRDPGPTRAAFDTGDFRFVVSTAATLAPELWTRFEEVTGKPVCNLYGMSEIGNLIFAGPDEATRRVGTIGLPADAEFRILDDAGNPAADGEEGELVIHAESVTPGYIGRETPRIHREGKDWFPTGDLVVLDDGLLRLVGRKKDILITGGNNVAPDEVNRALLSHPAVVEAATFGVPDPTWGDRVVSCVVLGEPAPVEEILEFVAGRLTPFKVPRDLHVVHELPKGRSGKVILKELAGRVGGRGPGGRVAGPADLEATVIDLAARAFRTPASELSPSTGPDDCHGWDSMAHLELVLLLEETFQVSFGPREIIKMQSLGAIVRMIQAKR